MDLEYDHKGEPLVPKAGPAINTVTLPCGCVVKVSHRTGDRLVGCECGHRYRIRARTEVTVYDVKEWNR